MTFIIEYILAELDCVQVWKNLWVCVLWSNILKHNRRAQRCQNGWPSSTFWLSDISHDAFRVRSPPPAKQRLLQGTCGVWVCVSSVPLCYADCVWQVDSLWHVMVLSHDVFWGWGSASCSSLEDIKYGWSPEGYTLTFIHLVLMQHAALSIIWLIEG